MARPLQHPQYLAHSFRAIHRSNWTVGRQGQKPQYIVIHLMAGTYEGSISWAQNPASNVSWHYAISRAGLTAQNLGEHQTAWTNSSWWHNIRSVTLEHEGFLSHGGPTEAQLHASAKITAGICYRHGIPIDRAHIFGHTEIKGVTKPCPGSWPWARYMRLVKQYRYPKADDPPVQSAPSGTVYKVLVGAFSQRSYADAAADKLKSKGFGSYVYLSGSYYRVQASALSDPVAADEEVIKLKAAGWKDAYALAEKS